MKTSSLVVPGVVGVAVALAALLLTFRPPPPPTGAAAAPGSVEQQPDFLIRRLLAEDQIFRDYDTIDRNQYFSRNLLAAFAAGAPPPDQEGVLEGNFYFGIRPSLEGARLLKTTTWINPRNPAAASVTMLFDLDFGDGIRTQASMRYDLVLEPGHGWRIDDIVDLNPPESDTPMNLGSPSLKVQLIEFARNLQLCRGAPADQPCPAPIGTGNVRP